MENNHQNAAPIDPATKTVEEFLGALTTGIFPHGQIFRTDGTDCWRALPKNGRIVQQRFASPLEAFAALQEFRG